MVPSSASRALSQVTSDEEDAGQQHLGGVEGGLRGGDVHAGLAQLARTGGGSGRRKAGSPPMPRSTRSPATVSAPSAVSLPATSRWTCCRRCSGRSTGPSSEHHRGHAEQHDRAEQRARCAAAAPRRRRTTRSAPAKPRGDVEGAADVQGVVGGGGDDLAGRQPAADRDADLCAVPAEELHRAERRAAASWRPRCGGAGRRTPPGPWPEPRTTSDQLAAAREVLRRRRPRCRPRPIARGTRACATIQIDAEDDADEQGAPLLPAGPQQEAAGDRRSGWPGSSKGRWRTMIDRTSSGRARNKPGFSLRLERGSRRPSSRHASRTPSSSSTSGRSTRS